MCLNTNFVVVIITSFCISSMCYTRIEYGKACGAGANLGVCKILAECPSAQAELKKPKYSPLPGCGFLPNGTQIICCKDFKSTSSTNHNHNIDEHSGIVWERETLSSITKKTPTLVDKNRGQKSETACAEYESKLTTSLDRHITAGDDANLGEFPHMAQIGYENPSLTGVTDWKCGGSLIHVRFVLTAAHCVETADKKYSPKVVRLGFVNINLPGNSNHVEREVLNNTVHPEYNRILQLNDIALIELVLEVKIDTYVYPACLYQKNDDPIHLIATGWGDTSTEATVTNYSQILQKVETEPVDLQSCSEIYRRDFTKMITPSQMCRLTPNSTADTCQGDSGGPLQKLRNEEKYMYDIVGVTAYGSGCGTGVTPGIYTRVYSYIDWIEGIVWP